MTSDSAIGIFDSGVGGISVLRDMMRLLPHERFYYYGDSLHAPYGTRPEEEIRRLATDVASQLIDMDIKALVIACNTATSAAAASLRAALDIPVIGMEPALKPAAQMIKDGKVLVLATPATLRQNKFQHLLELYGQDTILMPCPGLMEFAERGELEGGGIDHYLADLLCPVSGIKLDAAVLGCTHYVFLTRAIARALPGVPLIDGNLGTAHRLQFLLEERGLLRTEGEGDARLMTSGDECVYLPLMERLLQLPI